MATNILNDSSYRLKSNNFDLLRLTLAGVVCLVHAYQLSGFSELAFLGNFLSAELAVKAFFVISGFLIFMSYERSSNLRKYTKKRIRRIYPAYFTVIILCAVGLFFTSTKSAHEYFSLPWIKYLISNLFFLNSLQPSLPGVFQQNHLQAVNGALWTIKIEAMFYVVVPIMALYFKRFGKIPVIALAYLLSIAYGFTLNHLAEKTGAHLYIELGRQLPGQLAYFMAGAFLYYFLPLFEKNVALFLTSAIAVVFINKAFPLSLLMPAAIAVIVIFCALFCHVGDFGKYGDFSYGVYILHFPIIQALLASGQFNGKPFAFLATAVGLAGIGAVAMWHLVENRFLHRTVASPHGQQPAEQTFATTTHVAPDR
jgi:peptidoglycan/LPS O-acetylase OafA/YrhL